MQCTACQYKQNAPSPYGICSISKGLDGIDVMCVGNWVMDKYRILNDYLEILTKGLGKTWTELYYVDLFCGPGRSRIRQTGVEIDGSPLIALKKGFTDFIFVDLNKINLECLGKRAGQFGKRIATITGDCNNVVTEITSSIPDKSLGIAFVDPFGLDFNFDTYAALTRNKRMDLIINFPIGMAIKRNLRSERKLDAFLGGVGWKHGGDESSRANHITNFFKKNLEEIGYKYQSNQDETSYMGEVDVKNTRQNLLYYLLYASKHPLGLRLWNQSRKYSSSGQRTLFD